MSDLSRDWKRIMKYRSKQIVDAVRWFKNGDHPKDDVWRVFEDTGLKPTEPREGAVVRYYRHPAFDGREPCQHCRQPLSVHGFLDTGGYGERVCPGDWIVTESGKHRVCEPDIFEARYERVEAST